MSYAAPTMHLLPAPEPAAAAPPAPPPAMVLIRGVVETMMGRRALHQLRPHLATGAFHKLVLYTDSRTFRRTAIGRVRTQMPADGAVEASVQLAYAGRWLTCVIRLDEQDGRWRCTDVTMLTPASIAAA